MSRIIIYGALWCHDTRESLSVLDQEKIDYKFINIDEHPDAAEKVRGLNNGNKSIPTIIFPDDSYLTEPDNEELSLKLKIYK